MRPVITLVDNGEERLPAAPVSTTTGLRTRAARSLLPRPALALLSVPRYTRSERKRSITIWFASHPSGIGMGAPIQIGVSPGCASSTSGMPARPTTMQA